MKKENIRYNIIKLMMLKRNKIKIKSIIGFIFILYGCLISCNLKKEESHLEIKWIETNVYIPSIEDEKNDIQPYLECLLQITNNTDSCYVIYPNMNLLISNFFYLYNKDTIRFNALNEQKIIIRKNDSFYINLIKNNIIGPSENIKKAINREENIFQKSNIKYFAKYSSLFYDNNKECKTILSFEIKKGKNISFNRKPSKH